MKLFLDTNIFAAHKSEASYVGEFMVYVVMNSTFGSR